MKSDALTHQLITFARFPNETLPIKNRDLLPAALDLDNLPPEPRRRNREHPLFLLGKEWGDRVDAYVKRMHRDLPGVAEELGAQFVD